MAVMEKPIESIIHPKYDSEIKANKVKFMLKMSYDSIFYTVATLCAYLTFKDEYWFPGSVGGCGACGQIYK